MIDRILIDMDGVIADFVSPSLKAAAIPLSHDECNMWNYFSGFMTEAEFWSAIESVDGFWDSLEPYSWAHSLVHMCKSVAPVYFCSSPARHKSCAGAKIHWLREHGFLKGTDDRFILTPHKHLLANPGTVLIDDGKHNIDAFRGAGGSAITFPMPWNDFADTNVKEVDDKLWAVKAWLDVFAMPEQVIASHRKSPQVTGKNIPGESILSEAERLTGVDRQADYGPPDKDFLRTAGMWTAMLQHKLAAGEKFEAWEVAQMMICVKLSRLQHSHKRDSVVDAAGYSNCMDYCYRAAGRY